MPIPVTSKAIKKTVCAVLSIFQMKRKSKKYKRIPKETGHRLPKTKPTTPANNKKTNVFVSILKAFVDTTWKIILIIGSILGLTAIDFFLPKVEFIVKDQLEENKPFWVPIEIKNNSRFGITNVEPTLVIDSSLYGKEIAVRGVAISRAANKVHEIKPNASYEFYENSADIQASNNTNAKTYLHFNLSYNYLWRQMSDTLYYKFQYLDNGKVSWMKR